MKRTLKTSTTVRLSIGTGRREGVTESGDLHKAQNIPLSPAYKPPLSQVFSPFFPRFKRISSFCALLSILECVLLYLDYKAYDSHHNDPTSTALRGLGVIIGGLLVLSILYYYTLKVQMLHKRGLIYCPNAVCGLWCIRPIRLQVSLELAVLVVFIPPRFDFMMAFSQLGTHNELSLSGLIYPFILLRLYLVLRWLYYMSEFKSKRARWYA